jgi:hypothetical protein
VWNADPTDCENTLDEMRQKKKGGLILCAETVLLFLSEYIIPVRNEVKEQKLEIFTLNLNFLIAKLAVPSCLIISFLFNANEVTED